VWRKTLFLLGRPVTCANGRLCSSTPSTLPTSRMDDTSVPRRTLLTDAQRAALLAIPTDETTLIRHYTSPPK
jgi:hypothetical protein